MARMKCRCGEMLSNQEAPNEIELKVYGDVEWEEIFCNETIDVLSIPLPIYNVWRCPVCKRLYFFEQGSDVPHIVYAIEE